jgi:hypothetical protein
MWRGTKVAIGGLAKEPGAVIYSADKGEKGKTRLYLGGNIHIADASEFLVPLSGF